MSELSGLKPCPFCGGTATLEKDELIDTWFIECHNDCIGNPFGLLPETKKEDVINAWNKRHTCDVVRSGEREWINVKDKFINKN